MRGSEEVRGRPQAAQLPSDSELLRWLFEHHANWGSSSAYENGVWHDSSFVRVPCHHTHEWHCYDCVGGDYRSGIIAAMNAGPCTEHPIHGCHKRTSFWDGETILRARLERAKYIIADLEAQLRGAATPNPPSP